MKKRLIIAFCITILVQSYTNEKVYAYEEPVAGFTTILDQIDPIEIDLNTYKWTTERVNLRSKPSLDADIIKTLDNREKVIFISESNDWTKVKYGDETGCIYSKYLRDNELPSLDFTDEEIDLIAKIVWIESRGESDEGEAGVVTVIKNRLLSKEFSDTILEVLSDTGEFSSWKLIDTAKPTEREYEIIDEVLNGEWDILTDDTVYFSTSPRNNNIIAHIGNHWFCEYD